MALSTTARSTPVGTMMEDGFSAKIAFENDPDVSFWEVEATPHGYDGGEPIDQTTHHNSNVMTKAAQAIYEITDAGIVVAYDPVVLDQIRSLINTNGGITVRYPNGDTEDFFGYLRSFIPQALVKGTRPLADVVIVATNIDPSDDSEIAPNYKTSAGTD